MVPISREEVDTTAQRLYEELEEIQKDLEPEHPSASARVAASHTLLLRVEHGDPWPRYVTARLEAAERTLERALDDLIEDGMKDRFRDVEAVRGGVEDLCATVDEIERGDIDDDDRWQWRDEYCSQE
ncbi:hypothetical protein C475_08802 [Halosimplex carlsbadense 2-9-1]|uniref:Uncharacterized protein n=2 Tax=Halosimplex carlsbadense TaxID=171164 RepID=M0CVT2_9EURY|nr:hypothetical protein C475_08802 [Halosimplex carlsbadense 2-9-1]